VSGSTRAKPYSLRFPLTSEDVSAIDEMFETLFQDLGSTASQPGILLPDPVTVPHGGVGLTTYVVGDILYASAAAVLSRLADVSAGSMLRSGGVGAAPVWSTLKFPNAATLGDLFVASGSNTMGVLADVAVNNVLRSGGVGAAPAWGKVDLATDTTGSIGVTQGGTGQTAVAIGDLLYGSNVNTWSRLAISATAGKYLRSGGSGAPPVWADVVLPNTLTKGDLMVAANNNVGGSLAASTAGKILRAAGVGAIPAWSTFTIPDTFAKGDIPTATAANVLGVIAPATAGHVLTSNGAGAAASFQAPTAPSPLPPGSVTGDFVRWNNTSSAWEVAAEMIAFRGLVLTPLLAALADIEGAMFYDSATKSVKVCTSV
jgi:hypothetical protein